MSDKIIWSNGNNEYFDEFCKTAYEYYLDDPEFSPYGDDEYADFDEFQEQNFNSLWDDYQDDSLYSWDNIADMIHNQVHNYLYAVGTDTVWHGSYEGYKPIRYKGTVQPYDIDDRADFIDIIDVNGDMWVETYNHDGGMRAGLYTDSSESSPNLVSAVIADDVEELADKFMQQYDVTREDAIKWIYEDFVEYLIDGDSYGNFDYDEDELKQIADKYNLTIRDVLVPIKIQW